MRIIIWTNVGISCCFGIPVLPLNNREMSLNALAQIHSAIYNSVVAICWGILAWQFANAFRTKVMKVPRTVKFWFQKMPLSTMNLYKILSRNEDGWLAILEKFTPFTDIWEAKRTWNWSREQAKVDSRHQWFTVQSDWMDLLLVLFGSRWTHERKSPRRTYPSSLQLLVAMLGAYLLPL